jgi:glycosylphosphatidylinositol transamidase (GPIT) subunit GPI8
MEIQNSSISKNNIIKMAKRLKPERKNVSFRLNSELYDDFMKFCEEKDVSSANVIEALLEKLLEDKRH